MFGAGLLGTLFEYTFRKEQDEAAAARFRAIIHDEAPALRDAVINGFAIHKADLARVATPELLDDIAANAMALRLGDDQFARELYGDIRATRRFMQPSVGTMWRYGFASLLQ